MGAVSKEAEYNLCWFELSHKKQQTFIETSNIEVVLVGRTGEDSRNVKDCPGSWTTVEALNETPLLGFNPPDTVF